MRRLATTFVFLGAICLASPAFAQAADPAEIAFWNVIKDTRNPGELRAYLDAFPNGLFSQVARLRLQDIERSQTPPPIPQTQQTAPTPTPTPTITTAAPNGGGGGGGGPAENVNPVADTTPVDLRNRTIVREVQLKLYGLNYDPGRVDGVMTAATTTAIREWQEIVKLPITGVLTGEQKERLRNARTPSTCTARGQNGVAFNLPSRAEAEQQAVDRCLKAAGRRAQCKPFTGSGSSCITMATFTNKRGSTTYFGAHVALRQTQAEATAEAMRQCNGAQNSGGKCSAKVSVCADGGHIRA
jgi:hypothetical protein